MKCWVLPDINFTEWHLFMTYLAFLKQFITNQHLETLYVVTIWSTTQRMTGFSWKGTYFLVIQNCLNSLKNQRITKLGNPLRISMGVWGSLMGFFFYISTLEDKLRKIYCNYKICVWFFTLPSLWCTQIIGS